MSRTRTWTATHARIVGARQGWRCLLCNDTLDSTYELDHVIEHADGGSDDISNAQALCQSCHAKKTQSWRMQRVEAIRAAKAQDVQPEQKLTLPPVGGDDTAFLTSRFLKYAFLPTPGRRRLSSGL